MPYKDKSKQKEANLRAIRKYRDKGITEDDVIPSVIPKDVIPSVIPKELESVKEKYPHIVHVLADPEKRKKLRAICSSLTNHNQLGEVRYGAYGPTMDRVAEFLTAFKD